MTDLAKRLVEIKLSIITNATDVLFMRDSNTTVCEEIDSILLEEGVSDEEIQEHYEGPEARQPKRKWRKP